MRAAILAVMLASFILFSYLPLAASEEKTAEIPETPTPTLADVEQSEKPIQISSDVESHSYGISFCADNNSLRFDSLANTWRESVGTIQSLPDCLYIDVQETANVTTYNLTCIRERCNQIVNLDVSTGHVILLYDKEHGEYEIKNTTTYGMDTSGGD